LVTRSRNDDFQSGQREIVSHVLQESLVHFPVGDFMSCRLEPTTNALAISRTCDSYLERQFGEDHVRTLRTQLIGNLVA
jgi:hypothetical protein